MLQDVRKAAGYATANDAADALGLTKSTYWRYERQPDKIPMSAAIELAGFFGCSLDAVVGREEAGAPSPGGDVGRRFAALTPDQQGYVLAALEYAEKRDAAIRSSRTSAEAARKAWEESRLLKLEAQFALALEEQGEGDLALFGDPEEVRGRFEEYVAQRASAATSNPDRAKEVVEEVMDAYDRVHPEEGGIVEYAMVDL